MYGPKQINLYHMERHQEFTLGKKIRLKRFCKTTTKDIVSHNSVPWELFTIRLIVQHSLWPQIMLKTFRTLF